MYEKCKKWITFRDVTNNVLLYKFIAINDTYFLLRHAVHIDSVYL